VAPVAPVAAVKVATATGTLIRLLGLLIPEVGLVVQEGVPAVKAPQAALALSSSATR
jgi:hypothetical protein